MFALATEKFESGNSTSTGPASRARAMSIAVFCTAGCNCHKLRIATAQQRTRRLQPLKCLETHPPCGSGHVRCPHADEAPTRARRGCFPATLSRTLHEQIEPRRTSLFSSHCSLRSMSSIMHWSSQRTSHQSSNSNNDRHAAKSEVAFGVEGSPTQHAERLAQISIHNPAHRPKGPPPAVRPPFTIAMVYRTCPWSSCTATANYRNPKRSSAAPSSPFPTAVLRITRFAAIIEASKSGPAATTSSTSGVKHVATIAGTASPYLSGRRRGPSHGNIGAARQPQVLTSSSRWSTAGRRTRLPACPAARTCRWTRRLGNELDLEHVGHLPDGKLTARVGDKGRSASYSRQNATFTRPRDGHPC
jgi:hypothetical protein